MTAQGDVKRIYATLQEPFAPEMERQLRKGGANLTYIPQAEVIARLNNALGLDNWSEQVINVWRDPTDLDFVLAHLRLTAIVGDKTIVRDGFGGQKINRTKAGDPVDLGDDYKGAVSDALKKAATTLGVALYLARDAEALEVEAAQNEPEPEALPEPSEEWKNFVEQTRMLNKDGRDKLNEFWLKYNGNKEVPKPQPHNYNPADLEALSGEAIRLIMDGQYAKDPS
jgi:hypothetical protein